MFYWESVKQLAWVWSRPLRCAVGAHPPARVHPLWCPALVPGEGAGEVQRWWCEVCKRSWGVDGVQRGRAG